MGMACLGGASLCVLLVIFGNMAGIFKTFSPKLEPMHISGMKGDSPEGAPTGALGYVAEGFMTTTQYDPEKFPLTEALKGKGITEEKWEAICSSLRKGKGFTGMDGGFSKAIAQVPCDRSRTHHLAHHQAPACRPLCEVACAAGK